MVFTDDIIVSLFVMKKWTSEFSKKETESIDIFFTDRHISIFEKSKFQRFRNKKSWLKLEKKILILILYIYIFIFIDIYIYIIYISMF